MKRNIAENIEQESPSQQSVPSILSKKRLLPGDRVLWVIVAMFFAFSLVAVYTASSQLGLRDGTIDRELQRHFATLVMSAIILFICYMSMRTTVQLAAASYISI